MLLYVFLVNGRKKVERNYSTTKQQQFKTNRAVYPGNTFQVFWPVRANLLYVTSVL